MKNARRPIFKFNTPASPKPFFIAGPCVIESEKMCLTIAERLAKLSSTCKVDIVFKASYDKANRTSIRSFRGPGRKKGLKILEKVKKTTELAVLTDVHCPEDAAEAGAIVDVVQIPALLCRQTDLLLAAKKTGRFVNIKKGQFMAPADMRFAVDKAGKRCWLTERGTFFGYNRLVVDFTGICVMKAFGVPVIFDATHSVQSPGAGDGRSTGDREMALPLARAAICAGADGLFFEVHPDPDRALCDGPNSLFLKDFEKSVPHFCELYAMVASWTANT